MIPVFLEGGWHARANARTAQFYRQDADKKNITSLRRATRAARFMTLSFSCCHCGDGPDFARLAPRGRSDSVPVVPLVCKTALS